MSGTITTDEVEATGVENNAERIDQTSEALHSLLDLIDNPQDFLSNLLITTSANQKSHPQANQVGLLRAISKELFLRVEKLAVLHDKIESGKLNSDEKEDGDDDEEGEEGEDDLFPLSGLPELYTGFNTDERNGGDDDDEDLGNDVDSETIFNQVDIQNTALLSKVKKTVRKLGKKIDNGNRSHGDSIRLLNMEDIDSDEENEAKNDLNSDENGIQRNQSGSDGDSEDGDGDGDEDEASEDEESRRIRERMERSMVEMEGPTDEEENNEFDGDLTQNKEKMPSNADNAVDPSREELYDGFFDLHEMENFADEEEEMLPDEAFGEPEPDNEQSLEERKKSLPHVRGREGRFDDDYEDDDEFNALEKQIDTSVRRKRYRDEEDIKALTGMYGNADPGFDEEEEEEEDDVINMTAADYFGPPKKPSKMFLKKVQGEKAK